MKRPLFEEIQTSDTVVEFIARERSLPVANLVGLFVCLAVVFYVPLMLFVLGLPLLLQLYSLSNTVSEESMTTIRDFGVQLRIKYWNGYEDLVFYHADKIGGILIQECIKGSGVQFYFSFIINGENELSVAFENTCPGLQAIQRVYEVCADFLPGAAHGRPYPLSK